MKQSKTKLLQNALVASLFWIPLATAQAEEDEPNPLQLHQFSTIGYKSILTTSRNSELGVVNKNGTFLADTLYGLNIIYNVSDSVSVYGQFVAAGSNFFTAQSTLYKVNADMVMLSYRPFKGVDIRLGRQIYPIWMVSEQIDVGVTYPWIAPPSTVYTLAPIKSGTAIGADYKTDLTDNLVFTAGGRYGDTDFDSTGTNYAYVKLSHAGTAYVQFNYDNMVKLRASYGTTTSNQQYDGVPVFQASVNAQTPVDSKGNPTGGATTYQAIGKRVTSSAVQKLDFKFYSVGINIDYNDIFFLSEYAATDSIVKESVPLASPDTSVLTQIVLGPQRQSNHNKSYYATLGYRFSKLTPHFTYSTAYRSYDGLNYDNLAPLSTLTGGVLTSAMVIAGFNSVNYYSSSKLTSATLGFNYNFMPTVVGKIEFAHMIESGDGVNFGILASPTVQKHDIFNTLNAAISFSF